MGRISPAPRKPKPPLGALLYNARIERGIGLRQLEAETGTPTSTIQAWENGQIRDPRLSAVLRLAHVLGIPLDALEEAAIGDWVAARNALFHGANGGGPAEQIVDEATAEAEGLARQAQRSSRKRGTR